MHHHFRAVGWLLRLSVLFLATGAGRWACGSDDGRQEVVLRDLGICQPQGALSATRQPGRWQLISYTTDSDQGTMIGAGSLIDAPAVTLPLELEGWHQISLGIWNPVFAYDGEESVLKVRLSGDPCPRIVKCVSPTGYQGTQLQEYDFGAADVTGQNLVIGKRHSQKAYLAYVRLRPLGSDEVAVVQARWARPEDRKLVASHDGAGYLTRGDGIAVNSREDVWAQIEPYRHTDVKRVTWAVNYSHVTNWPSQKGSLLSREFPAATRHEQTLFAALNGLIDQGINPLQEACEHAHRLGIEFDAQLRMAILGRTPPDSQVGFVAEHPEARMIARDGTPIEKASYAVPATREFLLAMLRDTATRIDVDGITLNFIRGGEYIGYEQPVAQAFRQAHGLAPQEVEPTDERLRRVRAGFITQLVRDARLQLREIARRKGRELKLHVLVYPSLENNLGHALDVMTWIEEGLIASVMGADVEAVRGLAHAHHVEFYPGIGARDVASYLRAWSRWHAAADGYFVWDMDYNVELPGDWAVLGRMGHDEDMRSFAERQPSGILGAERLVTVGGVEVVKLANEEAGYPQKFLFLFSGG